MAEGSINTETLIGLLRLMGHDIRAPLGSLISTNDMLIAGTYDPLTDKQMHAAQRMKRNSRRALAITSSDDADIATAATSGVT